MSRRDMAIDLNATYLTFVNIKIGRPAADFKPRVGRAGNSGRRQVERTPPIKLITINLINEHISELIFVIGIRDESATSAGIKVRFCTLRIFTD